MIFSQFNALVELSWNTKNYNPEDIHMTIAFIIALGIVIFGVVNYDKMSYKANYLRNKENNTGYYWGGRPRNSNKH